ncbi:unnamed protein product, partial [Ixodes persulcatus]
HATRLRACTPSTPLQAQKLPVVTRGRHFVHAPRGTRHVLAVPLSRSRGAIGGKRTSSPWGKRGHAPPPVPAALAGQAGDPRSSRDPEARGGCPERLPEAGARCPAPAATELRGASRPRTWRQRQPTLAQPETWTAAQRAKRRSAGAARGAAPVTPLRGTRLHRALRNAQSMSGHAETQRGRRGAHAEPGARPGAQRHPPPEQSLPGIILNLGRSFVRDGLAIGAATSAWD